MPNFLAGVLSPHWRRYAAKVTWRWRICALNIGCFFIKPFLYIYYGGKGFLEIIKLDTLIV
jgi:hypothetical protein